MREDVPEDGRSHIRYATFLSYALTDAGEYDRAADVVREALALADDQTDPYTRVRLYWSLARLSVIDGRSAEALEYIRSAIALLKATDDTLTLARAYLLAAGAELRTRSADEARPSNLELRRAPARRRPGARRPRHAAHRPVAARGARRRRRPRRRASP